MRELMDASVIGDTGKEVLYWMKSGGFALCREDAEHWKCGEVSRERALSWCREKGLPERDYLPAFGLWEHFTVNEKGEMIFPGEPLIFRAAGPMVPVKREGRQEVMRTMKPIYCTNEQAKNCRECAFSSYGRDCQNAKIQDDEKPHKEDEIK